MAERNISITPSQFAEKTIRIPVAGGIVDFSFDGYEFFRPIYDTPSKNTLIKAGRQVGKSTTVANIALSRTSPIPNFRTLVVHPSAMQSKTFSEDRLKLPIAVSPYLRSLYPTTSQSVFHKRCVLRSDIMLRYAFLSASRIRGIPADMVIIDEFQDILREHIPIIEQVCFHSPYKFYFYTGTPLTEENTIETYWEKYSTQNEWVVPCRHHGTPKDKSSWHWNILGMKNIGKEHLICEKCGEQIKASDPDSQWVMLQDPKGREDKVTFEGYRIPQLLMHFMEDSKNWQELLRKKAQYPINQFYNEVLGLPYSSGISPISRSQLIEACNPDVKLSNFEEWVAKTNGMIYLGVDWTGGTDNSYTVMVLGGYVPPSPVFQIFWIYRFTGEEADPEIFMERIIEVVKYFQIKHIGSDYGGGLHPNNRLLKEFGLSRVHMYQYLGRQRTGKLYQAKAMPQWYVSRSEVMTDMFTALKAGLIRLPCWEEMEPTFAEDFLAIRSAYNYTLKYTQYDKVSDRPDDAFHAALYCFLASQYDRPRPDIILPRPADQLGEDLAVIRTIDREAGFPYGGMYGV
jgi:hypothetical protein